MDAFENSPAPDNEWLAAGLAALKQGDALNALAYLNALAETQPEEPVGIRARMGLVLAYEKHGQPDRAIGICRTLMMHLEPKVQRWSERTMNEIISRYPDLAPLRHAPLETLLAVSTDPPVMPLTFIPTTASPAPPTVTPAASPEPAANALTPAGQSGIWQQRDRTKPGSSLPKLTRRWLWGIQALTAIVWFVLVQQTVQITLFGLNEILVWLPFVNPIPQLYRDCTIPVLIGLGGLLLASPWLWDLWLRWLYGLTALPTATLATYSPETPQLLNQTCRQHKIPQPTLKLLPTETPLLFTYGWLPRYARIVVSQGLLDRLPNDEIATLYLTQVGHLLNRDGVLMSWGTLLLQIPYALYWQAGQWADRIQSARTSSRRSEKPASRIGKTLWFGILVALSSLGYALFRLWRYPLLWLSRSRLRYSDRFAAIATGNPNGLSRALLHLAIGTAESIQQQGYTHELFESLELLTPVGYESATSLGSLCLQLELRSLLQWESQSLDRHWLVWNQSHPLMGDRLQRLAAYARSWRLVTELDGTLMPGPQVAMRSRFASDQSWKPLLLQGAPFFGLLFGLGLGLLAWLVGGLAILLDLWQINWLWGDLAILKGCIPIGFGLGTFLRLNRYFPEIQRTPPLTEAQEFPAWMAKPQALPIDSPVVYWQGKLLGRPGVRNWLGQDLLLQTAHGLIRLHYMPALGPIGMLLTRAVRPVDRLQRSVMVLGWWRRGATPWIDLDAIRTQAGKPIQNGHPLWSTILGCLTVLWGLWVIWQQAGRIPYTG